jgi:hypothetical protein
VAAIGTGWAETAWIEAAWIAEAWDDEPYVAPVALTGGVKAKKRTVKYVDKSFFPWTQPERDEIDNELLESLKPKRPTLKIVKRAPQPDFDDTLQAERLDKELVDELKRIETERKKRAKRHKAAIMLLLS